jgi:type VI secretion system protein
VFGVQGGRIGRAPDNDWVLTDPERYVSSHHAAIDHRGGEWWVTDLSRNGTYLNDERRPLGSGGRRQLANGDLLRIADYEILVEITPNNDFPPDSPVSDADFIETRIDFDSDDLSGLDTSGIRASDAYGQERPVRSGAAGAERDRRRDRGDAATTPRGEDRELWPGVQAFCRGAGLEPAELSADARAALLHQAGQLLREITVGFHELAQARAEFTRDFGILPATARREGSGPNPRPINVDEALRQWLEGDAGAKGLVNAARRSFAEVRRHELAVAAALKEAVNDMLVHIDPDELELQFGRGTRTPGDAGAFARYWQRYRELFRTFVQQGESGIPPAFAEEFGRAYRRIAALGSEARDADGGPDRA